MWLLVRGGADRADCLAWLLQPGRTVVGSGADCDIVLLGGRLSRRHLAIEGDEQGWQIEDLGSSVGSLLNGEPLTDCSTIAVGDVLTLDTFRLELVAKLPSPRSFRQQGVVNEDVSFPWHRFPSFMEHLREAGEPREILRRLLAGIVEISGAERGFVLLLRERTSTGKPTFITVAEHALADGSEREAISQSVCRQAIENGALLFIENSLLDDSCAEAPSLALSTLPRTIVCAPLETAGTPLGVVYVDRPLGQGPWPATQRSAFATACALATELLAARKTRQRLLAARYAIETMGRAEEERYVMGKGAASDAFASQIETVAKQDISVLITGETGTGKEMVARELHQRSRRARGPFIAVNCAALPREIIEAELFGAERGAFTGATERRLGRFELADGGTLFLDEIGEVPEELQVKLLRVLQERRICRLGGSRPVDLDFRLITATNAQLEEKVGDGSFRQDFYYRINVFRLELQPLRKRRHDIMPLAEHFLTLFSRRYGRQFKGFAEEAVALIEGHDWPGNIRELRNAIERAVVVERKDLIGPTSLPVGTMPNTLGPRGTAAGDTIVVEQVPADYDEARALFERQFLELALDRHDNNIRAVAREIGMSRTTLYKKLQRTGLDKDL